MGFLNKGCIVVALLHQEILVCALPMPEHLRFSTNERSQVYRIEVENVNLTISILFLLVVKVGLAQL